MTYNRITEEDVRGFKDPEKFMESYNGLVDKLNDQIAQLENLKKECGDRAYGWQEDRVYMSRFKPLLAEHSKAYDELMSMQEDLILKNAPKDIKEQLGINTDDGRDDV